MTGALLAMALIALIATHSVAVAAPKSVAPDGSGPPTALKISPVLRRVRFEVSPGGAAITHDLSFVKGSVVVSGAGDATLFVAFTAQARPLAIEATRHSIDDGGKLSESDSTPLTIVDLATRPPTAASLLGPANGAGHVLRVPKKAIDGPFGIRIRSAIATTPSEASKQVSLLARMGPRDGGPMLLERIEVGALLGASLRGARAVLCGNPSADQRPLTVVFPGYPAQATDAGTVAPSQAKRRADDDLCIDVLI